jgi:hypothetical protein
MLYFRPAAIALFTFLFTVSVMVEPASAVDSTSVVLEWDPSPDSGILGYKVYRTELSSSFSSPPLNGSTLVTGINFYGLDRASGQNVLLRCYGSQQHRDWKATVRTLFRQRLWHLRRLP